MWTDRASEAGSRSISSHRERMTGRASTTSSGVIPSRLSSSAWRAASRQVTFGPLPPTMIGTRGCWIGFGMLMARGSTWLRPRRSRAVLVAGEHPADDLEVVAEPGEPLAGLGEAVAVGEPLVALPAGADPELHPAAADRVHRADHLGRERRVAERGADDDVAEPDPVRQRREGRQRGERLERDLVGRARDGVEVVEQPDRFEAESLGLAATSVVRRQASDGSQPSYSPIQPCGTMTPILTPALPDRLLMPMVEG